MIIWHDTAIHIWHDRPDFVWHDLAQFGQAAYHIRERIIAAIAGKLTRVRIANAYNTDAGARVRRVPMAMGLSRLSAGAVWPKSETTVTVMHGSVMIAMPIYIEALAIHGGVNPSVLAEQLLADLIEAMIGIIWTGAFTSGSREIESGEIINGHTSGATALIQTARLSSGSWDGGDAAGTLIMRRMSGTFQAENLDVGGDLDVATIAGPPTGTDPIDSTTAGLAESIKYMRGGIDVYPEGRDQITGVKTEWEIKYRIKQGDPCHQ